MSEQAQKDPAGITHASKSTINVNID